MGLQETLTSLDMTHDELVALCTADLRKYGVLANERVDQLPVVSVKDVKVGALVAIWAHQRYRAARVWKVGRKNVSAVYLTPTGRTLHPNNITGVPAALIAAGRD